MFRNAKVGDKVYDMLKGWTTITSIVKGSDYPIRITNDDNTWVIFTLEGKRNKEDANPTLFWNEIKYEIPKKPFSLESAFRILEETNFKEASYDNYYIFYNVTCNRLEYDSTIYRKYLGIKFFTKESILKFFEEIEFNKISEQEFFDAYNKVFGGK